MKNIKNIGVTFFNRKENYLSEWKRNLLLFDTIIVIEAANHQNSIIDFVSGRTDKIIINKDLSLNRYSKINSEIKLINEILELNKNNLIGLSSFSLNHSKVPNVYIDNLMDAQNILDINIIQSVINIHEHHNEDGDWNYYFPILDFSDRCFIDSVKTKKQSVVNLVIENMPIIYPDTPINHIIEFKKDKNMYNRFLDLRNWITDISKSDLTLSEVQEKIEYLISEYERHMKLYEIKYGRGILKTTIIETAGLLENVVKLKMENITKKAFSLSEENADLLLAELSTPGKELSYIIKAKEIFNPK